MHAHNVRALDVFTDSLFNAQFQRFVGHTGAGGADIGECYAATSSIREGDGESWYAAWHTLAERTEAQAEASLALGHKVSARLGLLKASNYYLAAYLFMMQPEPDSRLVMAYRAQRRTFEKVTALFSGWGRRIEIPFEQRHLHGYFFPSQSPGPRPVLIITGGYDSTAEEAYFFSGPAALARGYHVVTYDGPGQGAELIENGQVFRPDWETVLRAVLAWVQQQPNVDSTKIAQLGISFGGYLGPRAASGVEGLAATIADPGQQSLLEEFRTRLPKFIAPHVPNGNLFLLGILERVMNRRMRHLTEGWALRRGLLVHGVQTPLQYLKLTEQYVTDGSKIRCPILICSAQNDDIGQTADALYAAVLSQKSRLRFTAAEGASGHCESLGRSTFNIRAFDWLDQTLEDGGLTLG
jgi:pimeloyl-ACP methyl ester carboxylesterase